MPKKKSLDADQCRGIICSQLLATVGMLDQMADRDDVTEQLEWLFNNRELIMVSRARLTPIAEAVLIPEGNEIVKSLQRRRGSS